MNIQKEVVPSPSVEKLMIKLGGDCNLKCKHCHCSIPEYKYNPDIIRWIKGCNNLKSINFNGGEPLLYLDTIKEIVSHLSFYKYMFKTVTNGTLLDMDTVDFFNDNFFNVVISFDGKESGRDNAYLPRWELARYLRNLSFSCYTSGSLSVKDIQKDVDTLIKDYHLRNVCNDGSICANFIHEIENADVVRTQEDVEKYLSSMQETIEEQLQYYLKDNYFIDKFTLNRSLQKWYFPKTSTYGVSCACSKVVTLTLDGRFLGCPYTNEYYGDIYTGFNVEKLENQIPDKCTHCKIFNVCRNTCFKNTTNHECIIAKRMYAFFKNLEKKYSVKFNEIFEKEYV